MNAASPARLSRLLAMVPYFLARPGIKLSTAAADLGLTQKQLTKDLEQLFLCGLPGYMPDDLIDIEFSSGYVHVGFTAGMDRPLKLTGTEANALIIALRTLLDTGAVDADAVRRAMAKIEAAVGGTPSSTVSTVDAAPTADEPVRQRIRSAVTDGVALAIRYYTPSRDEVTERIVDPIMIKAVDGHSYLEAWCRSSDAVRLFRFDRVLDAEPLDEPSAPPERAPAHTQPAGASTLTDDLPTARIEIDPDARWLLEYYAVDLDTDDADLVEDVAVTATLRYGSPQWLERFLLGFGGRVRLAEPTVDGDVAEAVKATAAAARARY
ncbi:WYL domain-containing protein [Gordonia sp. HY285]|uniref:helix-turn-helix transcriptional regulator n=1 Tax=Gordonia liuliyuniae TaxID=2911517 RepID=UPI001F40B061|nr:WYL domain-containing protein [Gordonia liuliyuniae]MCF8610597.1 WYL domain-containing protein [Gordonia liuliyuniae]